MHGVERATKKRAGLPLYLSTVMALLSALALPGAARAQWATATNANDIKNTNSGNVGVGTSNPDANAKVHVYNAPSVGVDIQSANSGGWSRLRLVTGTHAYGWFTGDSSQPDAPNKIGLFDYTAGAFRLMVDSSGNLGVGTVSPSGRLSVVGSDSIRDDTATLSVPSGSAYGPSLKLDGTGGSGHAWTIASTGPSNLGGAGKLRFYDITAGAARMILDTSGNLGLGTTAPGYLLHVEGDSTDANNYVQGYFKSTSTDRPFGGVAVDGQSQSHVRFMIGGALKWQWRAGAGTGVDDLRAYSWTLGADVLTLKNNGSVGVGTATPNASYKLDVNGAAHVGGDMTVDGNIAAKYQDVAEWVPSTQRLSAGTVVILNPSATNSVQASLKSYDTSVAGVVSARPGIALGEGGDGKVLVATTGRVRVKVDATRAPIHVGDLLVTSDVPGTAMKSQPVDVGGVQLHRPGTLIGKALEPLDKGVGEILVLLSLQ
jgi:hypothetical protein